MIDNVTTTKQSPNEWDLSNIVSPLKIHTLLSDVKEMWNTLNEKNSLINDSNKLKSKNKIQQPLTTTHSIFRHGISLPKSVSI